MTCAAEVYDHATYLNTPAGATGSGVCLSGYVSAGGHASRSCGSTGVWSITIDNRCLPGSTTTPTTPAPTTSPSCASSAYSHATFPATPYGETATGVCVAGYKSSSEPTRDCLSTGAWSSTIHNGCVVQVCFFGNQDGRWSECDLPRCCYQPWCSCCWQMPDWNHWISLRQLQHWWTWSAITGKCT